MTMQPCLAILLLQRRGNEMGELVQFEHESSLIRVLEAEKIAKMASNGWEVPEP
jgi:hypothetical protein